MVIKAYGLDWPATKTKPDIELAFIRNWGFINKRGRNYGLGMAHHVQEFYRLTWPKDASHRWTDLIDSELAEIEVMCGITGPASSGKTHNVAKFVLTLYWANPDRCTILCSTTTREMLDLRIFGEIKKYWKEAKKLNQKLSGHLMESKQRIVTDPKYSPEGREYRSGILGVACKKGEKEVNLSNYIGIKNEIVVLVGDELQMMNEHYLSALSNLRKNPKFLFIPLGNPLDQEDALGKICEPKDGYDSYPYEMVTTVYPTRYPGGKVVRLCGLDSPNMDVPEGEPEPYPFLIGRDDIEADAKYYGTESLQYNSMSLGILSRTGSARRIITRQACELNNAFDSPVFGSGAVKKLAALDAAYSGEGGDRCVLTIGGFGQDTDGRMILAQLEPQIIVPVNPNNKEVTPEDQIAIFCRDACQSHGIPDTGLYYDSTGRGSLGPSLARQWGPGIQAVEFGGMATTRLLPGRGERTCRDEYFNFVSELWGFLRLLVEAGQARGWSRDMVDEAVKREYMLVGDKKIQIEPKAKMKERTGRSPDLVDSWATLLEGARRMGFSIKGTVRQTERAGNKWLEEQQRRVKEMLARKNLKAA